MKHLVVRELFEGKWFICWLNPCTDKATLTYKKTFGTAKEAYEQLDELKQ